MKFHSDRLTFRGLYPTLKRALDLRCQVEKLSMEKTVIQILEKELKAEMQIAKDMEEKLTTMK